MLVVTVEAFATIDGSCGGKFGRLQLVATKLHMVLAEARDDASHSMSISDVLSIPRIELHKAEERSTVF